jgi:hypothetical protein
VLKGFMIFLMATFWLVSWSLAELQKKNRLLEFHAAFLFYLHFFFWKASTYQTKPKAPMPTGWRSEYLVEISQPDFPVYNSVSYLEVISKVVPKIWARTNSAMAGDVGLFLLCVFQDRR